MTFYDLVKSLSDEEVYQALWDHATEIELNEPNPWEDSYGSKEGYIQYHMTAWYELKKLEPLPSDIILCVTYLDETKDPVAMKICEECNAEPEKGYMVHGYSPTAEGFYECNTFGDKMWDNPIAPYYAIEYRPWGEWLGMKLSIETMCMPRSRVIAECLWEMTFGGNNQTEIQMQWGCIMGTVNDYMEAKEKGELEIHDWKELNEKDSD